MAQTITLTGESRAPVVATTPAAGLAVSIETGDSALLERLTGEWRELAAGERQTLPTQTPEWIAAYLRHLEPDARMVAITVRRDGRLRALLPLVSERIRYHGVSLTLWRWPNDRLHPDPIDLLHPAAERDAVLDALWRQLAADRRWHLLELADVAEGTALWELRQIASRNGFPAAHRVTRTTPILTLPGAGATFESAAAHVNTKFRATVRRRKRRLEETGEVAFRRIEAADPVELERFFALEASGWKGRNGTDIRSDPAQLAFYAELARETAARGCFTLYSLECAGEPVAMQLGMTFNGRYHLPKVAFDETKGEFSPGHILMAEIVRDCAERGLIEIDFLGNADDWKERWANTARTYHRVSIFRPSLAGRAGYAVRFKLMPLAKRVRRAIAGRSPRLKGPEGTPAQPTKPILG